MQLALHGNWVDLVIIVVLIFFIHQGFINGFWSILIDFVSFFGALLISLKTYTLGSQFLQTNFSLSHPLANAIGYLAMAVISEIIISFALTKAVSKLPPKILKNHITKFVGAFLSVGQGIILIAFALTFAISLPINPSIKTDISNSKIGGFILTKTTGIEKNINNIFGGAINESLTYLTVEPKSHESVPLDDKTQNLSIDKNSETKMFELVNNERVTRGGKALIWDTKLVVVAENYAALMWNNKYFGHYDKDGKDVGDRLQKANINYQIAGENLALAPTVEIAHTGLMNSEGHRENILEKRFKRIGIGVVDNAYYGKMFVQVFTD
jgi:uncharacterized protein YkwD